MKILILGATGSIGRLVVAQALQRGHSVRALVRDAGRAERARHESAAAQRTNLAGAAS